MDISKKLNLQILPSIATCLPGLRRSSTRDCPSNIVLTLAVLLSIFCVFGLQRAFAATQLIQISDTMDDAYEKGDGSRTYSDSYLYLQRNTVTNTADYRSTGFRFPGLNLPQGATVNSATFSVYAYASEDWDNIYGTVYAHDTDNAPNFSDNPYIISTSNRPRTAASAYYGQDMPGVGGWADIDVTSVVQEIVDRTGWSSGNALALLFIADTGTLIKSAFFDYPNNPSYAAKLDVDYTVPSDPGVITTLNHTDGEKAMGRPNQRKVVRDSNGYWYVAYMDWVTDDYEVFLVKSSDTTGDTWETPVKLAGSSGIIFNSTSGFYWPAIDIDRENDVLHVLFTIEGTTGSTIYTIPNAPI